MRATTLRGRIRQNHLGKMVFLYRAVNHQSLRDLAKQIGTTATTLMRIEHGQAFDAETLLRMWQWMLRETGREQ